MDCPHSITQSRIYLSSAAGVPNSGVDSRRLERLTFDLLPTKLNDFTIISMHYLTQVLPGWLMSSPPRPTSYPQLSKPLVPPLSLAQFLLPGLSSWREYQTPVVQQCLCPCLHHCPGLWLQMLVPVLESDKHFWRVCCQILGSVKLSAPNLYNLSAENIDKIFIYRYWY